MLTAFAQVLAETALDILKLAIRAAIFFCILYVGLVGAYVFFVV